MPSVLGHESAGIVEAVGDGRHLPQARRPRHRVPVGVLRPLRVLPERPPVDLPDTEVKMPPGVAKRLTWQGEHLNQFLNLSSFAEQMLVHEHALVKMREDMPLDRAA